MSINQQGDNVVFHDFGGTASTEISDPILVGSWTSEDFAKVYVKYRPRLESYARKFLRDQSEIDEVIQDAFMYLFLSQPELDSELGVLKFLQWKTRLLCLDLLRVSGRRPLTVLDDADNYDLNLDTVESAESEYDKMFDVAIVHAALSRIPDRQREALIRAEFGEQSAAQIGDELGVSENAARQLLMRARRSFRTELISEVNIAGIEVSEILSVAVRKAKEISKNAGAMIVVLILPLALALGFQYFSSTENQVNIVEQDTTPSLIPSVPDVTPDPTDSLNPDATPEGVDPATPNAKPTSDEAGALSDNGIISRKSEIKETSPTLILSSQPLNADGLVLTPENDNQSKALLTSLEGDKVEVILSRGSAFVFDFTLFARGTSEWQSLEVYRLDRAFTANGGLIVNAILVDANGKYWGVSLTYAADFNSVENVRIVGITLE